MLRNFDQLTLVFSNIILVREGRYIDGFLPIKDADDNILFEYKVSIDFSIIPPTVKELEELIPHDKERHLFPNQDWSCCLGYPMELISFWIKSNYDCLAYVRNKVIPYLANQHYYDRNGEWLVEGLDHDMKGAIQFYSAIFGTDDIKIISYRLGNIIRNRKYRQNDKCFCGSNIKYKDCHKKRSLTVNERKYLEWEYTRFRAYLSKKKAST